LRQIVEAGAEGHSVRLSTGLIQFVAADDVAGQWLSSRSARRSAAASSWAGLRAEPVKPIEAAGRGVQ